MCIAEWYKNGCNSDVKRLNGATRDAETRTRTRNVTERTRTNRAEAYYCNVWAAATGHRWRIWATIYDSLSRVSEAIDFKRKAKCCEKATQGLMWMRKQTPAYPGATVATRSEKPGTFNNPPWRRSNSSLRNVCSNYFIINCYCMEQADEDAASSRTLHMTKKLDSLTPKVKNHFATTELVN